LCKADAADEEDSMALFFNNIIVLFMLAMEDAKKGLLVFRSDGKIHEEEADTGAEVDKNSAF
jgi:hypothetical protein